MKTKQISDLEQLAFKVGLKNHKDIIGKKQNNGDRPIINRYSEDK